MDFMDFWRELQAIKSAPKFLPGGGQIDMANGGSNIQQPSSRETSSDK
jgi:hypothetical protein